MGGTGGVGGDRGGAALSKLRLLGVVGAKLRAEVLPAEVRQTSARLVGGRRNLRQVLSRLGLVGSPRLRER